MLLFSYYLLRLSSDYLYVLFEGNLRLVSRGISSGGLVIVRRHTVLLVSRSKTCVFDSDKKV